MYCAAATFVSLLLEVESTYEVHDYIRSFLGETDEVHAFAKLFLEKRQRLKRNQQQKIHQVCVCARACVCIYLCVGGCFCVSRWVIVCMHVCLCARAHTGK